VGNGTTKSTSKREPVCQYTFVPSLESRDIPGVEINTGRGLDSSGLDGLLGILDLVVCLA